MSTDRWLRGSALFSASSPKADAVRGKDKDMREREEGEEVVDRAYGLGPTAVTYFFRSCRSGGETM